MDPPESSISQENPQQIERVCRVPGVQLAPEKRSGPIHMLVYLSITINNQQGELRLPVDKLKRPTDAVATWLSKKVCTRRELESLLTPFTTPVRSFDKGDYFYGDDLSPECSKTKAPSHLPECIIPT